MSVCTWVLKPWSCWCALFGRGGLGLFEGVTGMKERVVRLERENKNLKAQLEGEV